MLETPSFARRPALEMIFIATLVCSGGCMDNTDSPTVEARRLSAFKPAGPNWSEAARVEPGPENSLVPEPGHGVLVSIPAPATRGENLFTTEAHGDVTVELDFMLPAGSNSGIYLQSRYEVQLFDSWGKTELDYGDCGGIYARHDQARGSGREGNFEGHRPRVNACRPPGTWQHLQIQFRAPRFRSDGSKADDAVFERVVLNGVVVQENVRVTGPTRASPFADEQARSPLMLQGDHGPVAYRGLILRHL